MAAPLSLSIVQPQSVTFQKMSPLLHFLAGVVFICTAFFEYKQQNFLTAFSEAVIGADVLVIAFIKRFAEESTKLNAWFRLIETVLFSGIGILLLLNTNYIPAVICLLAACLYGYVFYCERQMVNKDRIEVHHLGVTISSFPRNKDIEWQKIASVNALPHSITITTYRKKTYHFEFQKGIELEQLEQIHEFCGHYLK
jgi:hypothetical protein